MNVIELDLNKPLPELHPGDAVCVRKDKNGKPIYAVNPKTRKCTELLKIFTVTKVDGDFIGLITSS